MASTSACLLPTAVAAIGSVTGASKPHADQRGTTTYSVLISGVSCRSSNSSLCPGVSSAVFLRSSSRRAGAESRRPLTIVAAKVTETNDATEALNNVLKSLQDQWEKVDDKLAIGGLGFSALIVLWASTGLIGAIDKLPFIPSFFEFVGILFSGWFVYRYLLFKPDREELLRLVDEAKAKITESTGVGPDA
jgi:hypothetical protein